MAQAIITSGELHLIGHVVDAKAEGITLIDGKPVMLYTTTPPKFKVGGNQPIWFQQHHLSFAPARIGNRQVDKRDKTVDNVVPFQWTKL